MLLRHCYLSAAVGGSPGGAGFLSAFATNGASSARRKPKRVELWKSRSAGSRLCKPNKSRRRRNNRSSNAAPWPKQIADGKPSSITKNFSKRRPAPNNPSRHNPRMKRRPRRSAQNQRPPLRQRGQWNRSRAGTCSCVRRDSFS